MAEVQRLGLHHLRHAAGPLGIQIHGFPRQWGANHSEIGDGNVLVVDMNPQENASPQTATRQSAQQMPHGVVYAVYRSKVFRL